MNKLVSAIIPTFERSVQLLDNAIQSIRNQSYPYIEIIVVNDNLNGSSYFQMIRDYCFRHTDLMYFETGHKGACRARNYAAKHAQGEYLAFLDDDDIWLPHKIEKQLQYFAPGIGMVFCNGYWVNTTITPAKRYSYRNIKEFHSEVTFEDLLYQNYVGTTSQILVSKESFIESGMFDEKFIARQDYDLCLRISRKYRIVGCPEYLFEHYLHHGKQIIKDNRRSLFGYQMLYRIYRKDFQKYLTAKSNICYRIARAAYNEKCYILWLRFLLSAIMCNPKNIRTIWEKTRDGRTF